MYMGSINISIAVARIRILDDNIVPVNILREFGESRYIGFLYMQLNITVIYKYVFFFIFVILHERFSDNSERVKKIANIKVR